MKKLLLIAVLGLVAFSCNKDQKAVNQLDGEWKAQFFYATVDGETSPNLVDPTTTDNSFSMNFTSCKLKNEDFCPATIDDQVDEDGLLSGSWLFRSSDDGEHLELKRPDLPFIHQLEVVEQTKVNLKVVWTYSDDLTIDIKLKKE